MRKLLISMSLTYLLVDCFYNFLLPVMLVTAVIARQSNSDFKPEAKAWKESMQLISDIRIQFVLAFNIQMVYFYYKLSLPTADGIPDVIEEEEATFEKSMDLPTEYQPKLSERSHGQASSFARFLENDSGDPKEREQELFNNRNLTENQRFLAQAGERQS